MCDLTKEFKLCSCDGDKLPIEKVDWILERVNPKLPLNITMGMIAMPNFTGIEKNIKKLMLTHLNEKNCFDFEYQPLEQDFLLIKSREIGPINIYQFRYLAGMWTEDESISFDRYQYEFYRNGNLNKSINELFAKEAATMPVQTVENITQIPLKQEITSEMSDKQKEMLALMMEQFQKNQEITTKQKEEDNNTKKDNILKLKELGIITELEYLDAIAKLDKK